MQCPSIFGRKAESIVKRSASVVSNAGIENLFCADAPFPYGAVHSGTKPILDVEALAFVEERIYNKGYVYQQRN